MDILNPTLQPFGTPRSVADRVIVPEALRACKILIVDDEAANVRLLERVLEGAGFIHVRGTTISTEAARISRSSNPTSF